MVDGEGQGGGWRMSPYSASDRDFAHASSLQQKEHQNAYTPPLLFLGFGAPVFHRKKFIFCIFPNRGVYDFVWVFDIHHDRWKARLVRFACYLCGFGIYTTPFV